MRDGPTKIPYGFPVMSFTLNLTEFLLSTLRVFEITCFSSSQETRIEYKLKIN